MSFATFPHVSTTAMFAYTLMNDVLKLIPVIIDVIELIIIGRDRHYSTAIHMSSAMDAPLAP